MVAKAKVSKAAAKAGPETPANTGFSLVDQPEPTNGVLIADAHELAAISAAVEVLWPKPTVEEDVQHTADAVWKFANRWWQSGAVLHRNRPRRPSTF